MLTTEDTPKAAASLAVPLYTRRKCFLVVSQTGADRIETFVGKEHRRHQRRELLFDQRTRASCQQAAGRRLPFISNPFLSSPVGADVRH
jgi:hypothetical protein